MNSCFFFFFPLAGVGHYLVSYQIANCKCQFLFCFMYFLSKDFVSSHHYRVCGNVILFEPPHPENDYISLCVITLLYI